MEILEELRFTHTFWAIVLPCILMILDIITGYYNAWEKNEISSKKMRDGLGKKLAELIYIVIGMLISCAFGVKGIGFFISGYVVYMELVSIAENCKKLGVELPKEVADKLNNDIEKDDGNGINRSE